MANKTLVRQLGSVDQTPAYLCSERVPCQCVFVCVCVCCWGVFLIARAGGQLASVQGLRTIWILTHLFGFDLLPLSDLWTIHGLNPSKPNRNEAQGRDMKAYALGAL